MGKARKKTGGTCECIERVNTAMRNQGQNQEVTASIRLRPEGVFAFAVIETEKVDPRRRTKDPRLIATFCPFCGVKYAQPSEPSSTGEESKR